MPSVIAIAAHPDDIEFVMAGTLLMLQRAGWEIHCLNVANGNLIYRADDMQVAGTGLDLAVSSVARISLG